MTSDSPDTGTLSALEDRAPRCPHGHGRLTPEHDPDAHTGLTLTCHQCGTRRPLDVALLRSLLDTPREDEPAPREDDTVTLPAVPAHTPEPQPPPPHATERTAVIPTITAPPSTPTATAPPTARGLRPDGTIRTTGWFQIGGVVISSGLWAALLGLAAGCLLLPWHPATPLLTTATAWTTWKITTVWIRPASLARNRDTLRAGDLRPGMCIRIYGPIGPVGVLHDVSPGRRGRVRLHFGRDNYRYLPADTSCHRVELRT